MVLQSASHGIDRLVSLLSRTEVAAFNAETALVAGRTRLWKPNNIFCCRREWTQLGGGSLPVFRNPGSLRCLALVATRFLKRIKFRASKIKLRQPDTNKEIFCPNAFWIFQNQSMARRRYPCCKKVSSNHCHLFCHLLLQTESNCGHTPTFVR